MWHEREKKKEKKLSSELKENAIDKHNCQGFTKTQKEIRLNFCYWQAKPVKFFSLFFPYPISLFAFSSQRKCQSYYFLTKKGDAIQGKINHTCRQVQKRNKADYDCWRGLKSRQIIIRWKQLSIFQQNKIAFFFTSPSCFIFMNFIFDFEIFILIKKKKLFKGFHKGMRLLWNVLRNNNT